MIRYIAFSLLALLICTAAAPRQRVANSIIVTNRSGTPLRDFPLQFGRPFVKGEIAHAPRVLLDGKPLATQADVKNRYPDGSVEFAVVAVVIPSLPAGGKQALTFADQPTPNNTPLSRSQMLDPAYDFDTVISATGTSPGSQPQPSSARAMLQAGDYKLWTSGPVAQTVLLGDNSIGRKYDIGFGDGFHPLRPRFVATFWPVMHQVFVRVVAENDLTTEVEDLAYTLQIKAGMGRPRVVYTADLTGARTTHAKQQWALSNWSRTFWLGATPAAQVDIDYNLAYLASTRWLPSFDTSIKPTEAAIAREYALWSGRPHDLYDGIWDRGLWQNAMGTAGERQEIGPYPTWDVLWLYTGDWRMRQMALGMDDLAAAFPGNLRESDPSRRLQRHDRTGLSPETGLGHAISITDRKTIVTWSGDLTFAGTQTADKVKIVGPFNLHQPFSFDGAHQPSPWFVPYVLTGDPFYLGQAYLWAGFSAARYDGSATNEAYGRGPTGAEGVINDETRGAGWVLRNRAETALIAPDADPEKGYFTTLTNDALARWEGGFGITGTAYDGTAVKLWGSRFGNYYTNNKGPFSNKPPSLGNWESNGNPATTVSLVMANERNRIFVPGAVGSFTAPWMQYYVLYALGRAKEVGFATGPLLAHTGAWLIGMVNNSGRPKLIAMYEMPVEKKGGGFMGWRELIATLQPGWLDDSCRAAAQCARGLPSYFAANLNAEGRQTWAIPGASYLVAEPGGAQAWSWVQQNIYRAIPDFASTTPKWAIVPRTDTSTLPPMPTR